MSSSPSSVQLTPIMSSTQSSHTMPNSAALSTITPKHSEAKSAEPSAPISNLVSKNVRMPNMCAHRWYSATAYGMRL